MGLILKANDSLLHFYNEFFQDKEVHIFSDKVFMKLLHELNKKNKGQESERKKDGEGNR